jgi:adenylyltransferase/sulfurtransferase
VLYTTNDIGKYKVDIAKERLNALNPFVEIETYKTFLNNDNAESIISKFDIVVDCPDNYDTRYVVSKFCKKLGKPHVYGSISKYEGQLSVFNYKSDKSYSDLFVEPPDEKIIDNDPSAKGVIGVLPGIIGTMQANEAIKIITGIGEVLSEKIFIFNTLNLSSNIIEI